MSIVKKLVGTTTKNQNVYSYTITNSNNMSITLLELGASIQSLKVPDKNGVIKDVVLGFDNVLQYEKENSANFGVCVGRNANRIGNAHFVINGKEYDIAKNDGPNNLHSGPDGYSSRKWASEEFTDEEGQGVIFSLKSPNMDQGYPGNLEVTVTIVLTEDNSVILEYDGVSDEDTIFNMTNHSYFNLAGHDSGKVYDHVVWIDADEFTPGDAGLIPTGEFADVTGTPMDFRTPKTIGQYINQDYVPLKEAGGYDHNYVLKTNSEDIELVAYIKDPVSGRKMEVYTDLPGMQMYTGNFLNGEKGKDGAHYSPRDGVCFETQFFPDAINKMQFESPVIEAGVPCNYVTVYNFIAE